MAQAEFRRAAPDKFSLGARLALLIALASASWALLSVLLRLGVRLFGG